MARWHIVSAAVLVCAALAILLLPALAPAHYDGWPEFTIAIGSSGKADISRLKYFEILYPRDREISAALSDDDLWSLAKLPLQRTSSSVTVQGRVWGRDGVFGRTYNQSYGVLLLVPLPEGGFKEHLYRFPDFREADSGTFEPWKPPTGGVRRDDEAG